MRGRPLTARERQALRRAAEQQGLARRRPPAWPPTWPPAWRPTWRPPHLRPGCLAGLLAGLLLLFGLAVYLLIPFRTNLLLIGVDYIDPALTTNVARSDTIMLATVNPLRPSVGLLSIPRDLWVSIPGVGENRINTAHFYAEGQQPGSGPAALQQTIRQNFGVSAPYYVRVRFEGFREVVDALGGVDITLSEPAAGYPAGKHHLTGRKALAFVRERYSSDDFNRMSHGQLMIRALFRNLLNPLKWLRLPAVIRAGWQAIDTNLPAWLWPRLGFALLRAGPGGIDSRIVGREMVTPYTTPEGASVLLPNWELIRPMVDEMFH